MLVFGSSNLTLSSLYDFMGLGGWGGWGGGGGWGGQSG